MGGLFQIASTFGGVSLTELHTAILTAVAELGAHGPTASELERGLAQTEAQFIYRLQTVGGFGARAIS